MDSIPTDYFEIDIENYDDKVKTLKPGPFKVYIHLHRYMYYGETPRSEHYDNGCCVEIKKGQVLLKSEAFASIIKMSLPTLHDNLFLLENEDLIKIKSLSYFTKLVTLPCYK